MARLFVGTSGWTYSSWKGTFYPEELPARQYLKFYAKNFGTTEVNYSFYHLPKLSTYEKWASQVPDSFVFAVKASRFITHVKRLIEVVNAWSTFVQNARALGPHVGPVLLQFPPSFRCDPQRVAAFLKGAREPMSQSSGLRLAFEFRHESWFKEEIYALLRQHQAALCIADSSRYPRHDKVTADFVYVRFHGRAKLFASEYTDKELMDEATRIRRYLRNGLDVYVYFNNDARGYAVKNAKTLRDLVQNRR